MLRRKIIIRCGWSNCKHEIGLNTDDIREVEAVARHYGWLVKDKSWLYDMCPEHWVAEIQRRLKAGFEIYYTSAGKPRLRRTSKSGQATAKNKNNVS